MPHDIGALPSSSLAHCILHTGTDQNHPRTRLLSAASWSFNGVAFEPETSHSSGTASAPRPMTSGGTFQPFPLSPFNVRLRWKTTC